MSVAEVRPATEPAATIEEPPEPEAPAEPPPAPAPQAIIEASIAAYSGNCPCPYHTMKNGRTCGKTSAYNRPGGEAPLCYPDDVTEAMVEAHVHGSAQ